MDGPNRYVVDYDRMIALDPVDTSLGGQADYIAAIVTDATGAEFPMLVKLDAIDDTTVLVNPSPHAAHEQLGKLPVDCWEAVWVGLKGNE